jgi:two-component system response regulator HydG
MVDLPTQLQDFSAHRQVADHSAQGGSDGYGNEAVVSIADMEKQAILETIRQLKGDKLMAARLLGIGKTTLYRKLKEYGLAEVGVALGD